MLVRRPQLPRQRATDPWRHCIETSLGVAALLLGSVVLARAAALAKDPPASTVVATEKPASESPAVSLCYQLHASLDTQEHTIEGSGSIRYTNTTSVPTHDLYFHLYLNAFKSHETLFQRSPFRGARSGAKSPTPGYVDVKKLVALEWNQTDLWPNAERHSPGDPHDETDIRVPLPRPLGAGETLTLELAWHARLPQLSERTGYVNDFHMVAQWFPKLARREADGTWVHFAFHPHAEFYADFADFDVTLDVPENQIIGATGERVDQQPAEQPRAQAAPGRKQLRYQAQRVHDFAWTAWPHFLEHHETVDGVAVHVLYPQAAAALLERELHAVRFGLSHFGQAYGRYPYRTLTVVHPPANAAAAGGMEYPTLITTGGTVLSSLFSRGVELVTLHELGHQWFYGLLASNEAAAPFLDEGLTSYAEAVAAERLWGEASGGRFWDLSVSSDAFYRARAADAQHDNAVASPAASFTDFSSLGSLAYARTATILRTLQRVYGAAVMERALRDYSTRFRFGHPTSEDLLSSMRDALGTDAATALRSLLTERGWLDYRVAAIDCIPAGAGWVGEVLVQRHGTVSLPVDVALIARDGSTTLQHWNGREPWLRVEYRGQSPLIAAVVDPDGKLTIDSNLLNNARSLLSARTPRSFERLVYATQWALFAASL